MNSTMDDAEKAMKTIVGELLGAISRLDAEGLRPWLAPDVVMEFPYAVPGLQPRYSGVDRIVEAMSVIPRMYSSFDWTVTESFASPATGALIICARSDAKLVGGVPYRNDYVVLFRFRGDKVVLWREYFNSMKLPSLAGSPSQA